MRKVIKIRAEDSPNIRLAMAEMATGREPSGEVLVPGVMTWEEYQIRRRVWDKIAQTIGLDAEFYEGAEVKLYPPDWLAKAQSFALTRPEPQKDRWMGVDPAEGGDKSCWTVIDRWGVLDQLSMGTPDTAVITDRTLALMREHNVPAVNVCFDRGGGGKQHADRLREMGYGVDAVSFGEAISVEPRRAMVQMEERLEVRSERHAFANRRAEMYWMLRELLDPGAPTAKAGLSFAIGSENKELLRQLVLIPLWYKDGRFMLLPKNNPANEDDPRTLVKLIGHSPDEADSLVLAVYAMRRKKAAVTVGAMF